MPLESISVVIPTFGRGKVLVDTVRVLLRLETPPAEIVIVDQTPRHDVDTDRQIRIWEAEGRVNWLRLTEPSIPRAMNQGLAAATSKVVMFLDDDIVPDSTLVAAHGRAHAAFPGAIVAGRVLQPWHHGQPDSSENDPVGFNSLEPCAVTEFMGGNVSLPREDTLEIGGFDENFVRAAYRFEAEFADRWRSSGRQIWYEPSAVIHHLKARNGGTRTFGEHHTTARPDHSVGAYYFILKTKRIRAVPDILRRIAGSVATRHHLRHPWWIPVTWIAELGGLCWAIYLVLRGPRYISNGNAGP